MTLGVRHRRTPKVSILEQGNDIPVLTSSLYQLAKLRKLQHLRFARLSNVL